jgi:hypothetical protein
MGKSESYESGILSVFFFGRVGIQPIDASRWFPSFYSDQKVYIPRFLRDLLVNLGWPATTFSSWQSYLHDILLLLVAPYLLFSILWPDSKRPPAGPPPTPFFLPVDSFTAVKL